MFLDFQGALQPYNEALFGEGRFDAPQFIAAAKHFVEFKDLGAFNEDINALSAYEASALFCKGKAPMFVQGDWQMAGVVSEAQFEVGMFLFPTDNPRRPRATIASYGPYFAVSAKSPHKDVAAEFLDFVVYKSAKAWYEKTFVAPAVRVNLEGIQFYHPLAKKRAELVNEYLTKAVFDLHVTLPTSISQYAYGGIQAMLDHQLSPEAFWAEVQRRWEKEKKAGTIWQP